MSVSIVGLVSRLALSPRFLRSRLYPKNGSSTSRSMPTSSKPTDRKRPSTKRFALHSRWILMSERSALEKADLCSVHLNMGGASWDKAPLGQSRPPHIFLGAAAATSASLPNWCVCCAAPNTFCSASSIYVTLLISSSSIC